MIGRRAKAARWGAPLLIALALAATACHRSRPIEARPALFVVKDADTTIWLFGTIHLLPAEVGWRTPILNAAIDRADTLVTEIPDQQLRDGAAAFDRLTHAAGLPPALTRIDPGHRPALIRAIDAAGLTLPEADQMKTWAIATLLGGAAVRDAGADRAHGSEVVLARAFAQAGKPQFGLESLTGQLGLFDTLPESEQRALLTTTLDELNDPPSRYPATLAAWAAGDLDRIATSFNRSFERQPTVARVLLYDRNRRWAGWIKGRMQKPGRVLVAVGAGHLAGPHGVPALLRQQGLTVQRVQ